MGDIINIYKGNSIPTLICRSKGEKRMNYEKAYALLVGRISNAIDCMCASRIISQQMEDAIRLLKEGLEIAEEMYLSTEE
jgi:hypothetical protein